MRGLIQQILREEAEVKEMGIDIGKIKASQPKNYLVKSLKKKEKASKLKEESKKDVQKINKLYAQIVDGLTNLKWEDIELQEWQNFFYVVFPKKLEKKMEELRNLYGNLLESQYFVGLKEETKVAQLYEDFTKFVEPIYIYLYLDYPRNRTHFPKGLPKSFLGYNIGVKIYRKLLNTVKFIQSEENATSDVQEVYRKLMKMPDVNTIVYKDQTVLIEDGIPKNQVIEIVSDSIYERYLNKPSMKKLVLNRSIIVNTKLLRIVGETRLLNMMYEYYYSAKEGKKVPFETLGYENAIRPKKEEPENDDDDDYESELFNKRFG
jgi:hypothetical protein